MSNTETLTVDLVIEPGGLPDSLDTDALLATVREALAATRRINVADARVGEPAGKGEVVVQGQYAEDPLFGVVLEVIVRRSDSGGEVAEEYISELVGSVDAGAVPDVAADLALLLCDPDDYPEVMAAQGQEGRHMHPTRREMDPDSAIADAHDACLSGDPTAIREAADRIERIAAEGSQDKPGLWGFSSELRASVGDFDQARATLESARDQLPEDAHEAINVRLAGLAAWQQLGNELYRIVFEGGRILADASSEDEATKAITPLVGKLKAAGALDEAVEAVDWDDYCHTSFGERVTGLSRLATHLLNLGEESDAATDDLLHEALADLVWVSSPALRGLCGKETTNALHAALQADRPDRNHLRELAGTILGN